MNNAAVFDKTERNNCVCLAGANRLIQKLRKEGDDKRHDKASASYERFHDCPRL